MGQAARVCMLCQKQYGTVEGSNFVAGDVSHGICPECAPAYFEREMNAIRKSRGEPPMEPSELAKRLAGTH